MATEQQGAQSGFTLVEILVVLMLLGLLGGVLFSALRLGSASLNRVIAHQTDIGNFTTSQQVLDLWLEKSYPKYLPPTPTGLPGHVDFDGEVDSISFLTRAPLTLAPGGMAYMRLWIQQNGPEAALMLSARPELAWKNSPQIMTDLLLKNIASSDFTYFGADRLNGANYWHHSWKGRPALPILIRIRIDFPPGDSRKWPDLLIAPEIYSDQSCHFLQLTQTCLGR